MNVYEQKIGLHIGDWGYHRQSNTLLEYDCNPHFEVTKVYTTLVNINTQNKYGLAVVGALNRFLYSIPR